ncbi:MAG: hypothetical protein ACFFDY_00435 [Candidatus Thorarchaeota archaeon]
MGLVPKDQIKSIVNKYLYDSSITKSAIYKSLAKSHSTTTLEVTETPTLVSTRVLPIKFTKTEIKNSGGSIQEGDQRWLIREKDLSDNSVIPKIGDRITVDSQDWEVLDIEKVEVNDQGLMWEFHCRL